MFGSFQMLPSYKPINLPQKLATAFQNITDGLVGASYTPVFYAGTQIANGTNHMLFCVQNMVTARPESHLVKMIINEKNNGAEASIVSIETII